MNIRTTHFAALLETSRLRQYAIIAILCAASSPAHSFERQPVPADFVHDHVILTPKIDGRELRFFTDTGGGWNALSERAAETLGLQVTEGGEGDQRYRLVAFPRFDADATIPAPGPQFMVGQLMLAPDAQLFGADGFLGGRWFADQTWEIDYPRKRISKLVGYVDQVDHPDRLALGFQVNAKGERTMHFPSIDVEVDGEILAMLLDTGATATTTASSAPVFGVAPGTPIGTSFIEHEVFERWRQRNPDWRVLEAADQKNDQRRMIEVAELRVGPHRVGPVWFAEQPPGAFQKYMASMMDRPTWGALGGSALREFRLIIDYPNAAAYVHCETCEADLR